MRWSEGMEGAGAAMHGSTPPRPANVAPTTALPPPFPSPPTRPSKALPWFLVLVMAAAVLLGAATAQDCEGIAWKCDYGVQTPPTCGEFLSPLRLRCCCTPLVSLPHPSPHFACPLLLPSPPSLLLLNAPLTVPGGPCGSLWRS